jgi:hypothetical protein
MYGRHSFPPRKAGGVMATRNTKEPAAKRKEKAARAENRKIDEQVEESFPASDPPAFAGGKSFVGAPSKRETPAPSCVKPGK